jgi:hypothetical protein
MGKTKAPGELQGGNKQFGGPYWSARLELTRDSTPLEVGPQPRPVGTLRPTLIGRSIIERPSGG